MQMCDFVEFVVGYFFHGLNKIVVSVLFDLH